MTVELTILVLLILGLAFMALEAFMPAFGLLGLGGMVSFMAALIMLNDLDVFYGMVVNKQLLAALGLLGIAVLAASFYFVRKTLKTNISAGSEIMPGMSARVINWTGTTGRVHVDGEEWNAVGPDTLNPGDIVIIQSRDNLTLVLKKDA